MRTTPPTLKIGAALVLVAFGTAALVFLRPERLHAPAWVAYFALGLLAVAGVCVIAHSLKLKGLVRWLVCALLGAMAIIPGWIAFGSGPRQCTLVLFGASSPASEMLCREAFGVGAAILAVMFVAAVRGALRTRHTV